MLNTHQHSVDEQQKVFPGPDFTCFWWATPDSTSIYLLPVRLEVAKHGSPWLEPTVPCNNRGTNTPPLSLSVVVEAAYKNGVQAKKLF